MERKGGKTIGLVITGRQYPVWEEPSDAQSINGMELHEKKMIFSEESIVSVQKVEASFYQKGETLYWLYEEQLEGHPRPWHTRVKYKGNVLEVTRRSGKSTVSMLMFEAGKTFRTEYMTPFGSMLLDIVTESVELLDGRAETLKLKISYILEQAGKPMGKYELTIQGQEKII